MNDQLSVLRDPRAKSYLAEVHVAVSAVDPAAADGIMREIADHLREAAAEPGFDLDRALTDLGDPALIAAGVERPAASPVAAEGLPAPRGFTDSAAAVVTALALTVGTWWTFILGWAVGVSLLWSSRRFTRTDKIVGTAAWPFRLLVGYAASTFGGVPTFDLLLMPLVGIPIVAAMWLLVRGLGAQVPRPALPPVDLRAGRGAWLERPRTAALVLGLLAAGAAALVGVAAVGGRAGPLLIVIAIAATLLVAALVLVWRSRSWTTADSALATALLVAASVAFALGWGAAVRAGTGGTMCLGTDCAPMVTVRPEDLAAVVAPVALPLVLTAAVLLGVRFRVAGSAASWHPTARAFGIVAALTVGGLGFVGLVLSQLMAPALPLVGVVALVIWAAGLIMLWRAVGWLGVDRAIATLVLPMLAILPLLVPRRYAAASDAVNPLLPGQNSPPELGLAWAVFGVVSVLVAVWLLVRFEPGSEPHSR